MALLATLAAKKTSEREAAAAAPAAPVAPVVAPTTAEALFAGMGTAPARPVAPTAMEASLDASRVREAEAKRAADASFFADQVARAKGATERRAAEERAAEPAPAPAPKPVAKVREEDHEAIRDWISENVTPDKYGARLAAYEVWEQFADSSPKGFQYTDASQADFLETLRDVLNADEDEYPCVSSSPFAVYLPGRYTDALDLSAFDPGEGESSIIEWAVDGMLASRSVNMFVGLSETDKTWTALSMGIAVSRGIPWLGRVTKKGRVCILDFEMGGTDLRRRLRILGAGGEIMHKSYPSLRLRDGGFWEELAKAQPNFVIIDSLSAGSGNEFGELDSRFADPLREAGRFVDKSSRDIAVQFIHHSPKSSSLKDVETLFRGSGAIRGAVDNAYHFGVHRNDQGAKVVRLTSVKSRKGIAPEPFTIRMASTYDKDGEESATFELVGKGGKTKAPEADEPIDDRVLRFVTENPGCNVGAMSEALHVRKADIAGAKKRLEDAGQITTIGKRKATQIYRSGDVPKDASGTISPERIDGDTQVSETTDETD
jgi:hypothetical protein